MSERTSLGKSKFGLKWSSLSGMNGFDRKSELWRPSGRRLEWETFGAPMAFHVKCRAFGPDGSPTRKSECWSHGVPPLESQILALNGSPLGNQSIWSAEAVHGKFALRKPSGHPWEINVFGQERSSTAHSMFSEKSRRPSQNQEKSKLWYLSGWPPGGCSQACPKS